MTRKRSFQPVNPFHHGEMLLEEFLRPAGKTQTDVGADRGREAELAEGALERAMRQYDVYVVQVKSDPLLRNLHAHPRYKALLEKMGISVDPPP